MRIYLDHNATSPLRPEVLEAMQAALRDLPGNPSSVHADGAAARAAVETARARVAAAIRTPPASIVFTSGATEANNAALAARLDGPAMARRHVVTSSVEHPSVSEPLAAFEARGGRVTRVPVSRDGLLDPADVAAAIEAETALVSILWANNETGVVQPVLPIVLHAQARGIPVHLDATQCLGRLRVDLSKLPVTSLAGSAHKQSGPKGVGFLFLRPGHRFEPLLRGGPQERRRRGGTENVAGIVGLGVACELAADELARQVPAMQALRDRLWDGIAAKVPRARRNGSVTSALPNTLNVAFPGAAADVLLEALDLEGISVSAGAACHSGSSEPSPGLLALGLTPQEARASLRFSLGYGVDENQIDRVVSLLPDLVARVRAAAS